VIGLLSGIMVWKHQSTGITVNLGEGTLIYAQIPWMFWKATPTKTIDLSQVSKVFIADETNVKVNEHTGKVSVGHQYHLTLQGAGISKKFSFGNEGDRDNLYTLLTSGK
jgi:hypothetical protein